MPSKLGGVYRNMQLSCPLELANYGKCVVANAENIEKNICAKEFDALKRCFQRHRPIKK